MRTLFDYGYHEAVAGHAWHKVPPGLHSTRTETEAGAVN